jgi:dTDP-4-dehydrorhamnose 3,5-epimerase
MLFTRTKLQDAAIIDVEPRGDERGALSRVFCVHEFAEHELPTCFVQASTIHSPYQHTLRGLHFQTAPHAETKLVRCTRGAVWVVMLDLRPGSSSHLDWLGVELTAENRRQLLVPEGFAQGYQTLVADCEVVYQMTHEYVRGAASGVRWDDPAFGIEWPPAGDRLISERDQAWPDYRPPPTPRAQSLEPVVVAADE